MLLGCLSAGRQGEKKLISYDTETHHPNTRPSAFFLFIIFCSVYRQTCPPSLRARSEVPLTPVARTHTHTHTHFKTLVICQSGVTHPLGGCITGRADRENEQLCHGRSREGLVQLKDPANCLVVMQSGRFWHGCTLNRHPKETLSFSFFCVVVFVIHFAGTAIFLLFLLLINVIIMMII